MAENEQAVAELKQPDALIVERKPATAVTADEARTSAVSELLTAAYSQASTLKLTEAESKALRAPFTDDKVRGGAKGDERLLYISHIHVSDRLNDVLGIGQWALVKRSQRAEQTKTSKGLPLTRIYFEGVLLVRGAFVAEAVGVGNYHPNNPQEDYGSALESSMSDCLTRCCKRLGIGSQVWDKGYCDAWLKSAGGTRKPVTMPSEKMDQEQVHSSQIMDSAPSTGAKISGAQVSRLHIIADKANISDENLRLYLKTFGLESSKDIPKALYSQICAWAERGGQDEPGDAKE
jgi:hypothetical protein